MENITYDLSSFCNGADATTSLNAFLSALPVDKFKTLIIPTGKTLFLSGILKAPSFTTFDGLGTIIFDMNSVFDYLWNPGLIVNSGSHGATNDSNIAFKNLTINYDCTLKGNSLFRFRNVDNLEISKCTLNLSSNVSGSSFNAVIDLFKGCTNANIHDNTIEISTPYAKFGGGIWARNSMIANNDTDALLCYNVNIFNNTINSNGGDELIAVYSGGGDITKVSTDNNILTRKSDSIKSLLYTVIPESFIPGKLVDIAFTNNTAQINCELQSQIIIRLGESSCSGSLTDGKIDGNTVTGKFGTYSAVVGQLNGNYLSSVKNNTFTNTSQNITGSRAIASPNNPNWTLDNNKCINFQY